MPCIHTGKGILVREIAEFESFGVGLLVGQSSATRFMLFGMWISQSFSLKLQDYRIKMCIGRAVTNHL